VSLDLSPYASGLTPATRWGETLDTLRELLRISGETSSDDLQEFVEGRLDYLEGHPKWEVRRATAQLLGRVRCPSGLRVLGALSKDPDARAAAAASSSLEAWRAKDREHAKQARKESGFLKRLAAIRSRDPLAAREVEALAFTHATLILGGIGHDLSNVVCNLRELRETLTRVVEEGDTSLLPEAIEDLNSDCHLLEALVSDSKEFAAPTSSASSECVLYDSVQNALARNASRIENAITDVRIGESLRAQVPQLDFERALGNLIRNAAEDADGPVRLTFRGYPSPHEQLGPCVVLEVEDDGPGMRDPEGCMAPFRSTKKSGRGSKHSGLGLSIVKRVVELTCQGLFELESEFGVGTKAILTLPRSRED